MLAFFAKKSGEVSNKLNGRTDVLEAGAALGALVSAAEGGIEEKEIDAIKKALKANTVITTSFNNQVIDTHVMKALDKADGGTFSGKRALWKEIEEVANKSDHDSNEIILMLGADVAAASPDGISAKEIGVLDKAAKMLGLNLADYDIVASA